MNPIKNIVMLFALFFACIVTACSHPLPDDKTDYVGDWEAHGISLSIYQGGRVSYKSNQGGGSTSIDAPITEFTGDSFDVGVLFLTTTFKVTQKPHQVDGKWQMVVDGHTLTKVK